jgi:protein-tyrosine phosphatase
MFRRALSDPFIYPALGDSHLKFVLFICTGNFYRSRFAEAVFNYHAQQLKLDHRAFSRGLAIHLAQGDLSPHTSLGLKQRGIDRSFTGATRVALRESDLRRASHIIALDESEHRPMIHEQFPAWEGSITFWSVPDVDRQTAERALIEIERRVLSELVLPEQAHQ